MRYDHGDLQRFLEDSGVKNFDAREVSRLSLPPVRLWSKIIPTLQVAERLRSFDLISYIVVTSGYRDEEHNRRVGGSTNSLHLQFNALDIVPMIDASDAVPPVTVIKLLERDPLWPVMGVGRYSSFVHIDTRGLFTFNARGARF